ADVRAGAAVDPDLEIVAGAVDVLADVPLRPRLGERLFQAPDAESHLTADVDVGRVAADGEGGDDDALDQQMRIELDEHAILEGAGLALVGVDAEVARFGR